ncbi:MAG: E3 binding domain-containing protein [Bacteroidota bacterium]
MGYTTRLIQRRKRQLAKSQTQAATHQVDALKASQQLAEAGRSHSFGNLTDLGFTAAAAKAVDATPSALTLAENLGIDLHAIAGSGTDGRIIKRDVLQYAKAQNLEE